MKEFLWSLVILAAGFLLGLALNIGKPHPSLQEPEFEDLAEPTFEDLRSAIEQVESGGDRYAIGPGGERGILQLSEIYIDDVNRIIGRIGSPLLTGWEYKDAFDPTWSRAMFRDYTEHYLSAAASQEPNISSFEIIARIHNGGPNGWKEESTKPYWSKVKAVLEEEYQERK